MRTEFVKLTKSVAGIRVGGPVHGTMLVSCDLSPDEVAETTLLLAHQWAVLLKDLGRRQNAA